MLDRVLGVMRLNVDTFEEIEHDESATTQAAIIVAVVGVISGIGAAIATRTAGQFFDTMQQLEGLEGLPGVEQAFNQSAPGAFFNALISAFVGWALWAGVTYFVGTRFFNGEATFNEMLRVLGFAQAPQVLAIIPCIGGIIAFFWTIACAFVAIRQGLDLDNNQTILTILVSIIPVLCGSFVVGLITGPIF